MREHFFFANVNRLSLASSVSKMSPEQVATLLHILADDLQSQSRVLNWNSPVTDRVWGNPTVPDRKCRNPGWGLCINSCPVVDEWCVNRCNMMHCERNDFLDY